MSTNIKHRPLLSTVPVQFRRFYDGAFNCSPEELLSPKWHQAELEKAKSRHFLIKEGHYNFSHERRGAWGREPSTHDAALLAASEEIIWHLWALEVQA